MRDGASFSVRRPIGLRPPPDQIAFAVRLDCVRCPIRLRTENDGLLCGYRFQIERYCGLVLLPELWSEYHKNSEYFKTADEHQY